MIGGLASDVTLSQTVATTAGEHYTVDFWLANDTAAGSGDTPSSNDFGAAWNGTALMPTIVNAGQSNGYTEYQFDVTATGNQSTLEFSALNTGGHWDIDDVSVRAGAPNAVQIMSDATAPVDGVNAGDTLMVLANSQNPQGTVTATAGNGTVEWQFQATNAQLDQLMGQTQNFTLHDQNNANASQTVSVSVGGPGNDQFTFDTHTGADTMLNFSTTTNAQGQYVGDHIDITAFNNITTTADVLANLSADSHGVTPASRSIPTTASSSRVSAFRRSRPMRRRFLPFTTLLRAADTGATAGYLPCCRHSTRGILNCSTSFSTPSMFWWPPPKWLFGSGSGSVSTPSSR